MTLSFSPFMLCILNIKKKKKKKSATLLDTKTDFLGFFSFWSCWALGWGVGGGGGVTFSCLLTVAAYCRNTVFGLNKDQCATVLHLLTIREINLFSLRLLYICTGCLSLFRVFLIMRYLKCGGTHLKEYWIT